MISIFYFPATTSWQSNIGWTLDLNEWTCGGNVVVLCAAVLQWFSGADAGTYLSVVTVHQRVGNGIRTSVVTPLGYMQPSDCVYCQTCLRQASGFSGME